MEKIMYGKSEFLLFNDPVYYPLEDYEIIIEKLKNRFIQHNMVLSIYQEGEIKVPGLSDIDFFVVFKDNIKNLDNNFFNFENLTQKEQYLLMHPPFFISEKLFINYKRFFPSSNLRLLWGKKVKFNKPDKYDKLLMDLDNFFTCYPREYITQLLTKKVDVRWCLSRLNAIKYNIGYLSKNKKNTKHYGRFINEIKNLRKNWFKFGNGKYMGLIKLIENAIPFTYQLSFDFKKELFKNNIIKNRKFKHKIQAFFIYKGKNTIFMNIKDYKEGLETSKKIYYNTNQIVSIIPPELCLNLFHYSKYNGHINKVINNALTIFEDLGETKLSKKIEQRSEYINKHINFVREAGIEEGSFMSFNQEHNNINIKDKIKNLLRNSKNSYLNRKIKIKLKYLYLKNL